MKYLDFLLAIIFLLSIQYASGQVQIVGVINDGENPIEGAAINVESDWVMTDKDGKFAINTSLKDTFHLHISYLGFQDTTISIISDGSTHYDLNTIQLISNNTLETVSIKAKLERSGDEHAGMKMLESKSIKTVASSETIKRLPDRNAAEAMSRMAGVVMESDQGEGRYISFRGTPTDWSSALVNGDRMPVSNEESRGRSMDMAVLPTSLIDYIEYNQNITPDMEADAIGGSANFVTKIIPEQRNLDVDLGYGYNFKARKPQLNGTLAASDRFFNDKLGVLVGGSVFHRNWSTDNYEIFYGNNDDHSLERLELRKYNGLKTTYGLNSRLEYYLSDDSHIHILGFYGRMNDEEYNRKTMYNWVVGVGQSIRLQNIRNILQNELYGGEIGSELKLNDKLNLNLKVATYETSFGYGPAASFNNEDQHGYLVLEFEQLVRYTDFLFLDKDGNVTDAVNAYKRVKLLDIDSPIENYGDNYTNIQPTWEEIVPVKPSDTLFSFVKAFTELNSHREKDPVVAQIDLDYEANPRLNFKIGSKYKYKYGERKVGLDAWQRDPRSSDIILYQDQDIEEAPNASDFLSEIDSPYKNRLNDFMTDEQMKSFLEQNESSLIYLPFDENTPFYKQFIGSSYDYDESILSAYAMMNYENKQTWNVNFGMRVEHTETEVRADSIYFDLETFTNKTTLTKADRIYTSILPMLNVKYNLGNKSNLRFAATRSFRRPNFNEIKPGTPEIHYSHFHLLRGNPNLNPTYAWNFDLSYQKFTGLTNYVIVSTFYKYVTDHIYTAFESSSLEGNSTAGQFSVPGGLVAKEYKNAEYAYVFGAELNFKQNLKFIHSILKDLSISFNYSLIESKMKIASRNDLQPLPRQAKHVLNTRLSYENKRFNTSIGMNYRSPYLMELNLFAVKDPETGENVVIQQNNDYDNYMGRNLSLDASFTYHLNKNFAIYAQGNNLLNSEFVMYRGQRERPVATEYYGIRILAGIKYNLTNSHKSFSTTKSINHETHQH